MKKIFLFFILFCLGISVYAQDYIVLRNGREIIAKVFEVSTTEVIYKRFGLEKEPDNRIMPLAEVYAIYYENEKTLPYNLSSWVAAHYPKYSYTEIKYFEDTEYKRYVYRIKLQRKREVHGTTVWFTRYGDFLQEGETLHAKNKEKILSSRETSEANEMQTATSNMEEFKRCPYCGEEILAVAIKCKHCGEWLDKPTTNKTSKKQPTAKKSQGAILGNPFKGVAFGVNLLTGFTFKNSYSDVGFGAKLSYTFSVPIRLSGEFNILWGIPTNETWFLRTRWMDYGVCLQYLFLPGNKRVAIYPLVGIGGVNEKEKIEIKFPGIEDEEIESSINRFAFTLGYGFEGLSKNGKFCYGFGMRIKIANKAMGNNWGYRIHTVFGIGYKF